MPIINRIDNDSDFEGILESSDIDNCPMLQRLFANFNETCSNIQAYKLRLSDQNKEYARKRDLITNQIAQMRNTVADSKIIKDKYILDQKVCDKKKDIIIKHRTKLINEIDVARAKKEKLALELVDLNQDIDDMKKQKKDQWNAIKMACIVYKDKLDVHIDFKEFESHDRIKVTFFRDTNKDLDTYFVEIFKYEDNWQVGHIEPMLKETHLEELKETVDVSRSLSLIEIKSFICRLKKIFSQYYLKD